MTRPAILATLFMLCTAVELAADTIVATRTIRATEIIGPLDIERVEGAVPVTFTDPDQVIGMEARIALYAGRPIRLSDVGPPAIVERNQIVLLIFRHGTLTITAEGRAMGRGGEGDVIRAINLDSRSTVSGVVGADGALHVAGSRLPAN